MRRTFWLIALALGAVSMESAQAANPVVEMETSEGTIKIELFIEKSPITVKNFLKYVEAKHYDGLVFHRVIENFMIQGGGFDKDQKEKETNAPIKNEAVDSGLKNERGTIAMARTNKPDSATSQFFINHKDNGFLDPNPKNPAGYAVFGRVTAGMDVVDKIAKTKTGSKGMFDQDCPQEDIVIKKVTIAKDPSKN
jgi:cyclophilin family peptidyl-prolyl cis-trans isomerase